MRWLAAALLLAQPLCAGPAGDLARAIRENRFDRDECYRVRDLTLFKHDIRIYLNEGILIFSRPVGGRPIAAVFITDVEGGDGEVMLLPPNRAERRSLAGYISSPNLDDHFRSGLFLFTGEDYDKLKAQLTQSPSSRKMPEMGALLEEEWSPVLRNLATSYLPRLTLDLIGGAGRPEGMFAALFNSPKLGNFDINYDPGNSEQVLAGQIASRENRLFFDVWTSFQSREARRNVLRKDELQVSNYRIESTVENDLTLSCVTRVKVKPVVDGIRAATFDISPLMEVREVTVEGQPAEVLQRDSLRLNLARGGNTLFLVVPSQPLAAGKEYEFVFRHSGKVIFDAGERVFYVSARGNWYPIHGSQFAAYDLQFRYPKDLDMVSAGDVVEDRTEGEWRITRRRTNSTIRMAAFNLGNYEHARVERGAYVVDVCANRTVERALQPRPQPAVLHPMPTGRPRRFPEQEAQVVPPPPPPDPLARLHEMASEVTSALEFMASKFGPPALPHLTVSPIPGRFGQGFPGLVYLSTISYLQNVPGPRTAGGESQEMFYQDMLQAHETAHQWWGNRIAVGSYRDYWLMEALANYSALLYLGKTKGARRIDLMLEAYRSALLTKVESGQTVESAGPIVLGTRLETSLSPTAWRDITYGKGSWIIHMLRHRMGDERFFSLLAELLKRYDRQELTTEAFREAAKQFVPSQSEDPKLETFFDQWVYGTGIPTLKLSYVLKGKAPALRLAATLTQSDVDDDFSTLVPVEIQLPRGRTITKWVASSSAAVNFNVPLTQAPLKVSLDPRRTVLRR